MREMFEWFRENDIGRKLQAAVEGLVNGDNWDAFKGLESGEAIVKVTHNGEYIRFEKYDLALARETWQFITRRVEVRAEKAEAERDALKNSETELDKPKRKHKDEGS